MFVDILSQSNYVSYNVFLAHRLGLESAIYLSELFALSAKSQDGGSDVSTTFTVDRQYIENRTTFDAKKQKQLDSVLADLGILELEKPRGDKLSINFSLLVGMLSDSREDAQKAVDKLIQSNAVKAKKKTKEEAIRDGLYECIRTQNEELIAAYRAWIDAVYDRFGWMAKASVTYAQDAIDTASSFNLDVALEIIRIATINGYKDMSWAVNTYETNHTKKVTSASQGLQQVQTAPLSISPEIF